MNYGIKQKVFLYDSYMKYSSIKKCIEKFSHKYPEFPVPNKKRIYRIVRHVHRTGTVLNTPRKRRRHVLTEEMLDNIGVQLEANPNTSVRSLARQFGLSKTTAYKARKLLKEWPQDGKASGARSSINSEYSCDVSVSVDLLRDVKEITSDSEAQRCLQRLQSVRNKYD